VLGHWADGDAGHAPEEWGYCRNNDPKEQPSKFGLVEFVRTSAAKNRTQWYKRSRWEENIARGRDLLEKELGKSGFEALLKSDNAGCKRCNYHSVEDLLAGLGYEVTLNLVPNRWREVVKAQQPIATDSEVPYTDNFLTSGAKSLPTSRSDESPIAG